MFVTSDEQRGGLLVAIISGGRPKLTQRPTAQFVEDLRAAGVQDVVWVVSDHEADDYEPCPGTQIVTYPRTWAFEYASEHWMRVEPPDPEGFFGAFPGREWACLEAERRGCWGVLQLDDNINLLTMVRGTPAGFQTVRENGGMGLFVDMLAAVALSTNARTVGGQLDSVVIIEPHVARTGFPYSLFVERVGAGREHWFGPYEDDITHSFQYGTRADGATAAVVTLLRYRKESKSKTGMRAKYDSTRSRQLQRLFPQLSKVVAKASKSNGRGGPRVFHHMLPGAIRNPLTIHDPVLFDQARKRISGLLMVWFDREKERNQAKVRKGRSWAHGDTPTGGTAPNRDGDAQG